MTKVMKPSLPPQDPGLESSENLGLKNGRWLSDCEQPTAVPVLEALPSKGFRIGTVIAIMEQIPPPIWQVH